MQLVCGPEYCRVLTELNYFPVDKATSELLPSGSEDIALNLEISDQVRSKSVSAKDAMRALKRRFNHKNPNVQLLTLGVGATCIIAVVDTKYPCIACRYVCEEWRGRISCRSCFARIYGQSRVYSQDADPQSRRKEQDTAAHTKLGTVL